MVEPRREARAGRSSSGAPRKLGVALAALALGSAQAGCTWVSVEADGEPVKLLEASQLTPACQKIGVVSSQTLSKILFFPRSPEKIANELAISARNRGGELGGDAIVPSAPVEGGKQRFDLYRCSQS